MSSLSTLPKGDSAWLLRKSIQRIMQQVSVLETNIGSSTTGNSLNTQIIFNDAGTLRGDSGLTYNKTTDVLSVGAATITGDLTVKTNVLKVDTTNNRVGVVTATPRVSLDVASGDIYSSGQITWGGSSPTANQGFLSFTGGNAVIGSTGATALLLYTNGVERYNIGSTGISTWSVGGSTAMTLNSTGLGVGTSSIVNAAAGRGNVTIGGSSSAILNLSIGAVDTGYVIHDGTSIYLVNRIAAGSLIFSTNSTERLRIDSSGNVGVGITPSAWATSTTVWRALDLQYSCGLASSGAGSGEIDLLWNAYYDQTDQRWEFKYTGDRASRYEIRGSGVHNWYNTASAGTANAAIAWQQLMSLDVSGNLAPIGNLVPANGKGIDFSATPNSGGTMTSELLNDYEEGSWTPSITFGGASVGMTGTFAGRYTKVGRAVTINGIIALTAKGSSTGIAKIAGLPFTSANASGEYTAISIRLDRVSFADYPCGYVGPNSSVVELENTTNAGTVSSMTDSNFINTSVVIVNFTYTV